ncbi:MAG: lactate utilization protein [Dehalococcoidia bacterium]
MTDETDLSQEKSWFCEQRAETVVNNLQRKNIYAQYVSTRREALTTLLEMIPLGATVARGDSITIDQIGIIPELRKRKQNRVIYPLERDATGSLIVPELEQRKRVAIEAFSADIFLVGTNAVTFDGTLVNTDGWGNRVSAMIFGPEKVIIVAGVNKIVKDVKEALERIHNVAAPMNAKRHYVKHYRPEFGDLPCVKTGNCVNCNHDWRICRYTVIIEGTLIRDRGRINVVIVGEELGI